MSTGKWRSSTMVRIGTSCCPPPARDGRADVATVSVTMNLVWGDFCQGGAPRAFSIFLSAKAASEALGIAGSSIWRILNPRHAKTTANGYTLRQLIRLNGRTDRGVVTTKRVVDDARHSKPEQVILLRRTAVWPSS